MSDCKIYPADTVDVTGNVWATVGENIRNGLFGAELKQSVIYINEQKITSPDLIIENIVNGQFTIKGKKVFLVYPISCSRGFLSFRISYDTKGNSNLVSFTGLTGVEGKIGVLYTEK